MDEAAFQIDPASQIIPVHANHSPVKITFLKKGFTNGNGQYQFGDYLLPLRITAVDKNNIHPDKSLQYVPVSFRPVLLDRSNWEIVELNSCICDEPQYAQYDRGPEKLLDGDTKTHWGSKWDAPLPMPYYFIFDMKNEHILHQIDLVKPTNAAWRGNIKKGYFAFSNDGENWTSEHEWQMESNNQREHSFQLDGQKVRFIKLVITEAFDYVDNTTGADSGTRCDLAEFVIWGE